MEPEAYPFERAWNYALWLLGRQMRSKAQLKGRLEKKGARADTVARVMARLEELNYLDDAAYAELYVASRKRKKGSLAIAQELRQKGIAAATSQAALAQVDEKAQLQTAKSLIEKNLWRWSGKPQARAKAFAFLARRGFPGEIVKRAIEESALEGGR